MDSRLSSILFSQITHLPFLLVYVVGIVMAIVRWHLHPKVSMLALVAFALLLLGLVANMGTMVLIISGEGPMDAFMRWRGVVSLVQMSLNLIGWVLLLVALFGWRKPEVVEGE